LFVLTDIVGSVSLWERDAEAMSTTVARHDAIVGRAVVAAGGELVRNKGEGDSTFSVFNHPGQAVAAAVEIQGAIAAEEWPTGGWGCGCGRGCTRATQNRGMAIGMARR
jgi:hypothetical protein